MINLKRLHHMLDRNRSYKIFIDGKFYGQIRNREEITLDISPGLHKLYLKIDIFYSPDINLEVHENENITYLVDSEMKGWKHLLLFIYATFWRYRYIKIWKE